jgi:hypothetical protein
VAHPVYCKPIIVFFGTNASITKMEETDGSYSDNYDVDLSQSSVTSSSSMMVSETSDVGGGGGGVDPLTEFFNDVSNIHGFGIDQMVNEIKSSCSELDKVMADSEKIDEILHDAGVDDDEDLACSSSSSSGSSTQSPGETVLRYISELRSVELQYADHNDGMRLVLSTIKSMSVQKFVQTFDHIYYDLAEPDTQTSQKPPPPPAAGTGEGGKILYIDIVKCISCVLEMSNMIDAVSFREIPDSHERFGKEMVSMEMVFRTSLRDVGSIKFPKKGSLDEMDHLQCFSTVIKRFITGTMVHHLSIGIDDVIAPPLSGRHEAKEGEEEDHRGWMDIVANSVDVPFVSDLFSKYINHHQYKIAQTPVSADVVDNSNNSDAVLKNDKEFNTDTRQTSSPANSQAHGDYVPMEDDDDNVLLDHECLPYNSREVDMKYYSQRHIIIDRWSAKIMGYLTCLPINPMTASTLYTVENKDDSALPPTIAQIKRLFLVAHTDLSELLFGLVGIIIDFVSFYTALMTAAAAEPEIAVALASNQMPFSDPRIQNIMQMYDMKIRTASLLDKTAEDKKKKNKEKDAVASEHEKNNCHQYNDHSMKMASPVGYDDKIRERLKKKYQERLAKRIASAISEGGEEETVAATLGSPLSPTSFTNDEETTAQKE